MSAGDKMNELRSWIEVPTIAYYFQVFKRSFGLTTFDIEDLEEAILSDADNELKENDDELGVSSTFLAELAIYLLRGLYERKDGQSVSFDNYDECLYDLLDSHYDDSTTASNPLLNTPFQNLPTRRKVEILNDMINWRLYHYDASILTRNLDADEMRLNPVGKDRHGNLYWYFFGSHLYKEIKSGNKEDKKTKNKSKSPTKGKEKEKDASTWSLVCSSLEEWEDMLKQYKGRKTNDERELVEKLDELFEDEIPSHLKQREFKLKKKLLAMAPRKTSNRIALKMQQREAEARLQKQDRILEEERLFLLKQKEAKEKKKKQKLASEARNNARAKHSLRTLTSAKNDDVTNDNLESDSLEQNSRKYSTTKEDRAQRSLSRLSKDPQVVNEDTLSNFTYDRVVLHSSRENELNQLIEYDFETTKLNSGLVEQHSNSLTKPDSVFDKENLVF